MDLFLMRHADAVDGDGNDFVRTLSDKGRKQAKRVGDWLKANHDGALTIVSSPLPRARQTADIVAESLGKRMVVHQDERLACGMTPDMASGIVLEFGKDSPSLLLVGHAPDLGNLASYLLGGEAGTVEMRKAAIACFQTIRPGHGGSILQWLVTPKLLG